MLEPEAKTVKSARRVFEVLEFFTSRRTEATVGEIAQALGYPQSSTSELLRSLVRLGYLTYHRRLYRPSVRVALLGSWILPSLFRNGRLFDLMDAVAAESGENAMLATGIGHVVRYIHIVAPPGIDAAQLPKSSDRPMLRTASGKLLLSTLPDDELVGTVATLNAIAAPEARVPFDRLAAEIAAIRARGYAVSTDQYERGSGAIAVLLPIEDDEAEPLVIAIGARSAVIEAESGRLFDILRRAIDTHLPRSLHRIRRPRSI